MGESIDILVVDDDDITAELVDRALKRQDLPCRVVPANDGVEALAILRGKGSVEIQRPFLVLLDLNMPRMNGFEFLEELRADAEIADSVVFVLTTSNADSDRFRAYHEQIAGFMTKSAVGPQFGQLARLLSQYSSVIHFPA